MKPVYLLMVVISSILFGSSAFAASWAPAGGESCLVACENAGKTPVSSGNYTRNNNPYFVCRTNAKGEGKRAGYNLQPSWSNVCTVGWGGQEVAVQDYECLCQ